MDRVVNKAGGVRSEAKLATYAIDLLTSVIRPTYFAPTGYSLKMLAPAAGAAWRTTGAAGRDTLDWVEQARGGDGDMLNRTGSDGGSGYWIPISVWSVRV